MMGSMAVGEWIALYAAVLSTTLALAGFFRWLMSGARLSVTVFNPDEFDLRDGAFLTIVSNNGNIPTVIRKLDISFRTGRWNGREIGRAIFNEKSNWKPSVKLVATERPNSYRPEPNIINPGEELRAPAKAIREYDPNIHWIRVTAYARSRRRGFVGWSQPNTKTAKTGDQE
jgi:hypothetical protein